MKSTSIIQQDKRIGDTKTASPFEPGQEYSPYKLFHVYCKPTAVESDETLSEGAKSLFSILAYHAGEKTWCNPKRRTLAAEIRKSEDTVDRRLTSLVNAGYIRRVRIGLKRANEYHFVWHPRLSHVGIERNRTPRTCGVNPLSCPNQRV